MTSLSDVRSSFLDFFRDRQHAVVASSPLVPRNDPTLLFTNAGMVQFKNLFTGQEKRSYKRAASAQKCVRAGGKHNDLDNVGYTARHHTFFEMLGNFSFGDYFKADAIAFAWDLITKDFAIDKNRLLVTVYADDDEAFGLWKKIAGLPEEKIIRIATSANFWSMGDTGPCGPCSEIFYDHGPHIEGGPPGSPDEDGDRFVEIWNLVFMQFEQFADGRREKLPKPSIDTGMGLERVTAVLQGVHDNYDIDLFRHLIAASAEASGVAANGAHAVSHRVIADHLRSTSFLIADGVLPSNEGRGYVLRRIMRRAMRHAHLIGTKDPLMYRLVPALVAEMGAAYPELTRAQALIGETLKLEETRFRETLARGIKLLDEEKESLALALVSHLAQRPVSERKAMFSLLPKDKVLSAIENAPITEVNAILEHSKFIGSQAPSNTKEIQESIVSPLFDERGEIKKQLELHMPQTAEGIFTGNASLKSLLSLARPASQRAVLDGLLSPTKREKVEAIFQKAPLLLSVQKVLTDTPRENLDDAISQTPPTEIRNVIRNLPSLNRQAGIALSGDVAFKLHDTYGFPLDLTEDALRARGIGVDTDGFKSAMDRQKAEARKAWAGSGEATDDKVWFELRDELGATEFLGYDTEDAEGNIVAILKDGARVQSAKAGETALILTNQTPFYGESGGQIGDQGAMFSAKGAQGAVTDTEKKNGLHVHVVRVTGGEFHLGDAVELRVDGERRRATRANHSATHLLHAALKRVLGGHVSQKGSLVAPDRLRFDFAHPKPVSQDELDRVENLVNTVIRQNSDVSTRLMPTGKAIEAGAEALFGEKYGDEVRVLTMGDDIVEAKPYSVELCGGTHVRRLGDIGLFTILSESAVAAGVRRIEALTSEGARRWLTDQAELAREAASALKTSPADLPARAAKLSEDNRKLERELADAKKALALAGPSRSSGGESATEISGIKTVLRVVEGVAAKDLKGLADDAKAKIGSGIVAFAAIADGRASLVVGVTDDLTKRISAVDLVKIGSEALGGKGGGGRPDMAQAGGPDGAKAQAALDAIAKKLGDLAPA